MWGGAPKNNYAIYVPPLRDNIKIPTLHITCSLFHFLLQGVGEHVQLRRILNTERLFWSDCPLHLDPELHFPSQACSCLLRCHTRQHKKAWQKDKTWHPATGWQGKLKEVISELNRPWPAISCRSLCCRLPVLCDLLLYLSSVNLNNLACYIDVDHCGGDMRPILQINEICVSK